jgi:hypothetical protein
VGLPFSGSDITSFTKKKDHPSSKIT